MRLPPYSKIRGALRRWPLRLVLTVAAALVAGLVVTASDDEGAGAGEGTPGELLTIREVPGVNELLASALKIALPGAGGPSGPRYALARVRPGRRIELRAGPGGEVVARAGPKTEFNSPRTFFVDRVAGEWLGVPAPETDDNGLLWIRNDPEALDLYQTAYSVQADLSERTVEIRYGDRLVDTIAVTIGRAGSETPTGRYAVTDGLAGKGVGPYYGCCVLALTGHQPNVPEGWIGGDRIAIHGTPGPVGEAASLGCLRASDRDMVTLFSMVPLGAPVFITD